MAHNQDEEYDGHHYHYGHHDKYGYHDHFLAKMKIRMNIVP